MGGDSKPPMRNQGWAPSPPTPTSLTLGHPALEGGEVNRPTVGEQPWIEAQMEALERGEGRAVKTMTLTDLPDHPSLCTDRFHR